MNSKCFYLITACLYCCIAFAQESKPPVASHFSIEKKIPGNFNYLTVDVLNNIYVITNNGQLRKINGNGDSLASFNDVKKYGKPSFIDVSNPMKILVFYKPYAVIVTLDRLLTFRNNINLRSKQLFQVSSVASSYDNNIWIYDGAELKIKKIDDNGGVISEGQDMRLVTQDIPDSAILLENEKQIILYDSNKGFYLFDIFAAYKNTIPFLQWKNVAVSNKLIYGFNKNKLMAYEMQSLNLKEYELPDSFIDSKDVKAMNGKLYLLKKDGIEIYNID